MRLVAVERKQSPFGAPTHWSEVEGDDVPGRRSCGPAPPWVVGPHGHMGAGPAVTAVPKPNTSVPDSLAVWPALPLLNQSINVT